MRTWAALLASGRLCLSLSSLVFLENKHQSAGEVRSHTSALKHLVQVTSVAPLFSEEQSLGARHSARARKALPALSSVERRHHGWSFSLSRPSSASSSSH